MILNQPIELRLSEIVRETEIPDIDFSITAVPEPSTFALLWLALGVAGIARRRAQAAG